MKKQIEIPELQTPRERLLFLCKHLNIPNLNEKELHAAKTFPYLADSEPTDDFILGTQNVMLVMSEICVLNDTYEWDLPLLSKCYLYHWYMLNIESVITTTELVV
jgi:hypothetical protein